MVKQWNSDGGTVLWYSETVLVKKWNSDVGRVLVEQCGGTVRWSSVGGTVEK